MLQVLWCSSLQEVICRLFIKAVNDIKDMLLHCHCNKMHWHFLWTEFSLHKYVVHLLNIVGFQNNWKTPQYIHYLVILFLYPSHLHSYILLSKRQNFHTVVLSLQEKKHVSFHSVTCSIQLMFLVWGMKEITAVPCQAVGHMK